MHELTEKVAARSLDAEVKPYICFGGCDFGPNIVIHPQKNWYAGVKPEDLPETAALPHRANCIIPKESQQTQQAIFTLQITLITPSEKSLRPA